MNRMSQLSSLAAQIECAKSYARSAREAGQAADTIEKIIRGLRTTYAAAAAGLGRQDAGPRAFVLEVGVDRQHTMFLGDRPVPVSGAYIQALLQEAGLRLEAGQVILLDTELVRDLIEEALGRLAHDQAMAEKERAELQAALTRSREFRLESAEAAIGVVMDKADGIHRRKAALLYAGLALEELGEPKSRPPRAA